MTKSVLDRIKTGDFDGTMTDRELCSDINISIPEKIKSAWGTARSNHALLVMERDELPAKLNQANRAADLDDVNRLNQRRAVIYKEIEQARQAAIDAEIAMNEAQRKPLLDAISETKTVIAELETWQQRLALAQRRRDILATKADGINNAIGNLKRERA